MGQGKGTEGFFMTHIKPADYRFNYKAGVDLATSMYPQISDSFFFVDTREQNSHVNPVYECLGANWDKVKEAEGLQEVVKYAVISTLEDSTSCACRTKTGHRFIVMYFRRMWQSASSNSAFTLDHELGHQLVPSGFGSSKVRLDGESAADAFASLRTLQRFGTAAGRKLLIRASNARLLAPLNTHVEKDWIHLTGQVLMAIISDSDKKPFQDMSPEDTIAEAESYAQRYAPSRELAEEQWRRLNDIVDDTIIGNFGADTVKK